MCSDAELLRRYVEERSEAAFTELVRRHLNLVYFAALRQVGGDANCAEEVTQTVFTDLARKAVSLCHRPVLASWLHTSTHFAATKARRAEWRRNKYEQEVQTMPDFLHDTTSTAEWERLRPTIDGVIYELNETDREAVLQRFFEGRSFGDIGASLDLSEDAVRMRVDRALEKLHILLSRRGITSTSAALAAALANQATATAPAGLAASITGAALSGAATAGGGVVATVIAVSTATTTTAMLGVAAALTVAMAFYQTNQARAAAASLVAARNAHAAARARLTDLESKVQTAEKALADRQESAASVAASNATTKPPAVASTAASENARQQKALEQLLDSDSQLRTLRLNADRAALTADNAHLFASGALTPEQLEQRAVSYAQRKQQQYTERAAGQEPKSLELPMWAGSQLVRKLATNLYYTDDPFTSQQVKRLTDIFNGAKTTDDRNVNRGARFDWDRVLAEAEPILSPAQLHGLRAQAALGLMDLQLAAAARGAAAEPNR